jgi:tripartite-type tricarboxylate transporter receptor subunit TctC
VAANYPDMPAKDLKGLLTLLEKAPDKYTYGSSGIGTVTHVAGELLNSLTGAKLVHVPYRGNSGVLTDLLAGRVDLTFDGIAPLLPHIRSGKLRALGVTTAQRSPALPDVPAMGELIPGYQLPFWTGLYAPAGTPPNVIARVAEATAAIVKKPEIIERLGALGVEAVGMPAGPFDTYWREQLAYYGDIVRKSKITIGQ